MIRHRDSHIDHGLTEAQLQYLFDRFANRASLFVETITLPRDLGTVPCDLYGPIVGDPSIREDDVTYATRGTRAWTSRLIDLPPRQQHEVTVIAGPHEETCSLCKGSGERFTDPRFGATFAGVHPCEQCTGGKIKHPCVLYTAFGGPAAPQEPGDPSCKDLAESATFWREHALSK